MASELNDERNQKFQAYNTALKHFIEIIPTLPKSKAWLFDDLFQYKGFWLSSKPAIKALILIHHHHFKTKSNDIILSTFPKCGTTWLKALLFATINRTSYDFSTHPLLTSNPHAIIPFLEESICQDPSVLDNLPSPRFFNTHLPFTLIPEHMTSDGRFIYICRDPKDVIVSVWHFLEKLRPKELPPLEFKRAFDMFCDGVLHHGPYWDHVLSYWKASLEAPAKVLFLKYEDIKRETTVYVKRLAEFIEKPFSMEEENEGVVDEIVRLCSFEKMSNLEVNKNGSIKGLIFRFENSSFFRKGEVGDWKNYLTPEMAARVDQITKEKLHGSGLTFD